MGNFTAGLAGARYSGSEKKPIEDEVLERARRDVLQRASNDNADLESRRPETFTVYSSN